MQSNESSTAQGAIANQHQPTVPDEEDNWEGDSAVGGVRSYASSLTSLTPSIYEVIEEHGRTYHSYKSGKYLLPNDEKEQDRLDLQHSLFKQAYGGKLALAPINKIALHNVLDIATGTGIWAIEFADEHPEAHIIGTDLSPIQPTSVPVNCTFEVDDAEDEWLFNEPFQYIHARAVMSCFTSPKRVMRSAFEALAPGGYLEFQDPVMPLKYAIPPPENSSLKQWSELGVEASIVGKRPWNNAQNYAQWMRDVGFVDVVEEKFFEPVGPWAEGDSDEAKDLRKRGARQVENMLLGLEGMTIKGLARLGWKPNECRVLVAKAREELVNIKPDGPLRPYIDVLAVYGRKPENG